jgi:hypothetical protein
VSVRFACIRVLAVALIAFCASAQTSPAELAHSVVERWAAEPSRTAGLANVIRTSAGRAVLVVSGVPRLPNSGDATIVGRSFSGVYEAHSEAGHWKLSGRIPLDDMGQILAHHMKVAIYPGSGLTVEDRMRIGVKGSNGFAARLNHAAKIDFVRTAGGRPPYLFGGGLLWADLPVGATELTIRYSIDVEKGPGDTNSGCFLESAGHVRNQYYWHPFFDFSATGDSADFEIEVRIPKAYQVSTSIPQTDRIEGAERIIEGKTVQKAVALTLVYDREWNVERQRFGDIRLELFLSPDIQPDAATIAGAFRSIYTLLSRRFGALPGNYFGVVQARSFREDPGWRFASNQIVVAAAKPGVISMKGPYPKAGFGHEIAHSWTIGATGPAVSFLREGWAVWAERLILENEFGPESVKEFWKMSATTYFLVQDGKGSLMEDENNSLLNYIKGPWVFHMLEDALGREGFDKAIAEYSRRTFVEPSGWESLAECAQRYGPPDFDGRGFLSPWLAGKSAPHLTSAVNGHTVTIRQEPPDFVLPVVVEASTAGGAERHRIWITGAETNVTFSGNPADVQIDPDGALLLRR